MFLVRNHPVPFITRYSSNCNSTHNSIKIDHQDDIKRDPLASLPVKVREFVTGKAQLCEPERIHICDGSESENNMLINQMVDAGILVKLPKYKNW